MHRLGKTAGQVETSDLLTNVCTRAHANVIRKSQPGLLQGGGYARAKALRKSAVCRLAFCRSEQVKDGG
jgi:hypothetical protein